MKINHSQTIENAYLSNEILQNVYNSGEESRIDESGTEEDFLKV